MAGVYLWSTKSEIVDLDSKQQAPAFIQIVPSSFASSSKPHPEYNVFLDFRGEGTCNNFIDYLYYTLKVHKIITFKDDKQVKMGKRIWKELLDAIETLRIGKMAIINFLV